MALFAAEATKVQALTLVLELFDSDDNTRVYPEEASEHLGHVRKLTSKSRGAKMIVTSN